MVVGNIVEWDSALAGGLVAGVERLDGAGRWPGRKTIVTVTVNQPADGLAKE